LILISLDGKTISSRFNVNIPVSFHLSVIFDRQAKFIRKLPSSCFGKGRAGSGLPGFRIWRDKLSKSFFYYPITFVFQAGERFDRSIKRMKKN